MFLLAYVPATHSLGALCNPLGSVPVGDATANLHAAWPCIERFLSCLFVAWAQHDHVCSSQVMLPVQVGVVCGGVFGGPVGLEDIGRGGRKRATDYLLDTAGVQIYAGSKARHDGYEWCRNGALIKFEGWRCGEG